jgi:hypothetical protein
VEIASEYRYRDSVPDPRTLVVTISQSGETADTLAALKHARGLGMQHTLTICNVATSAMVRECELAYITRAGVEIGVASTKAFTTQLGGLFLLTLALAKLRGACPRAQEAAHLKPAPPARGRAGRAGAGAADHRLGEDFARKENALFLGRGLHYPIALEGALKLKEISYIHAEAYPAGELKHGPLALVTASHAGGHRGTQRRAAGKAQEQHAGSARPRRRALRALPTPTRTSNQRARHARHPHARALRRAVTHPARGAAAAAGVSHRLCARDGCGQAAQPGQECDGGVAIGLRRLVHAASEPSTGTLPCCGTAPFP